MQATQTRTIHTIRALRAISEHSLYSGETSTRARRSPVSRKTDGIAEQAEIWARRAAHANGFGGM